jgi:bifunctional DNase/RNase
MMAHPEPGGLTPLLLVQLAETVEGDRAAMLLRTADGHHQLCVLIPMNEANRLARVLGLLHCPCTPVYELIADLAAHFGGTIAQAVLDGQPAGITARLVLRCEGRACEFPCHPADAVALARRAGVPILATLAAMAHAQPVPAAAAPDAVADWVAHVRPSDFEAAPGAGAGPTPPPGP